MSYVDGFLIPIPTKNVQAYSRIAAKAGKVWMEHGALLYKECVADDMAMQTPDGQSVSPFPDLARCKRGETVLFSFIVYKSKAHRDRVNKKVLADPRILAMMDAPMPFDAKRMAFGGFRVLVDL